MRTNPKSMSSFTSSCRGENRLARHGERAVDSDYDELKALLLMHSQENQTLPKDYIGRVSMTELERYSHFAIQPLATSNVHSFEFVRSCRSPEEIPQDVGEEVNRVYELCVDSGRSDLDSARLIASALIMDHYRPEMPRSLLGGKIEPRISVLCGSGDAAFPTMEPIDFDG
ncbi:hypothetical protein TMatcc_009414 [Talaromyces marneffei ATCC 18224]